MNESITANVLAALNILAMERLDDGSFRLIGNSPSWFKQFCPDDTPIESELNIEEKFPFLGAFLFDAENFWENNSVGRLKSGLWTETDSFNIDYHLEASALCLSNRKVLLVELLSDYEEKQTLLQKLRDNSLNYDRVIKEIRAEVLSGTKAIELMGQTLNGRYDLISLLGQGGLGAVYKAVDLNTQQVVAVKLLLEDSENTIFSQQLFEREIKILKRVQHPNIVSILDSGITPTGRLFLVMDLIEGKPLDDLIGEGGYWTVSRTLNLLEQICPALYAIHEKNIIHRDLKPANILIMNPGGAENAMLLDLGIAKMIRGGNENTMMKAITRTGVILGTVQYLAPEQCLDQDLDEGVDIYALGTIVYELLAGDLPFQCQTINGWMMAHLHAKPVSLRMMNSTIPEEIEKVVLWALAKKRNERPSTTMEFLEKFREAAGSLQESPEQYHLAEYLDQQTRITESIEEVNTASNRGRVTDTNKESLPTMQSSINED
jgi:eukaryotic-like serine/threonine-protein kinase